jgi:hypothetical protein
LLLEIVGVLGLGGGPEPAGGGSSHSPIAFGVLGLVLLTPRLVGGSAGGEVSGLVLGDAGGTIAGHVLTPLPPLGGAGLGSKGARHQVHQGAEEAGVLPGLLLGSHDGEAAGADAGGGVVFGVAAVLGFGQARLAVVDVVDFLVGDGEATALADDGVTAREGTIASPARASLAVVGAGPHLGLAEQGAIAMLAGFTGNSYVGTAGLGGKEALGIPPVAVVAEGIREGGVVEGLEAGGDSLPVAVSVDGSKLGGGCRHRKVLPTAGRARRVRLHLYYNTTAGEVKSNSRKLELTNYYSHLTVARTPPILFHCSLSPHRRE